MSNCDAGGMKDPKRCGRGAFSVVGQFESCPDDFSISLLERAGIFAVSCGL